MQTAEISRTLLRQYCRILICVWYYGPLSVTDLHDDLRINRTKVASMCNHLRQLKLLRRSKHRGKEYKATDKLKGILGHD